MMQRFPARPERRHPAAPSRSVPAPVEQFQREDPFPLKEHLRILRRHWLVVAFGAAAGLGFAAYRVYTAQPEYRARAIVRLVDQRQSLTGGIDNGMTTGAMGYSTDQILSQLQILQSRAVAGPAIDGRGLRLRPATRRLPAGAITKAYVDPAAPADTLRVAFGADGYRVRSAAGEAAAPYGREVELGGVRFAIAVRPGPDTATILVAPRDAVIDEVLLTLRAHARDRTDIVDVEFTAHDPHFARSVLNAMVLAFQDQNAQLAQQQSRRRRIFLEEQLRQTESMLGDAQRALTGFREREQVFGTREKLTAQQSALLTLEMRREEMAADRRMLESLLVQLEETRDSEQGEALRTLVSGPGLASNPIIAQLFGRLTEYETTLDSLTAGQWGSAPTNPDVLRVQGLVATTKQRLTDAVWSHVGSLDARIGALDDLRARTAAEMRTTPNVEAEEARLALELASVQSMAELLRQELQRARIAEAVEAGQVEIVELATLPELPIADGRTRKFVLGLMLGLFLGGGLAFLLENMNTSIRRKDEIERVLRVPGLAVIPRLEGERDRTLFAWARPAPFRNGHAAGNGSGGNGHGNGNHAVTTSGRELVTLHDGRSSAAEAYRKLRTNLLFSSTGGSLRTVVVTSMSEAEGKTVTAANLAASFAQQGMRVLLFDCDLRRPRLHRLFGVERSPGLTDLIVGAKMLDDVVRPTEIEKLSLIPAGTAPPNPSELLAGPFLGGLLRTIAPSFDLMIIDTPPIAAAADATLLGAQVDGVVLVLRAGDTEREAAVQAVQQLTAVGARILGAVLNDPDSKVQTYGGYYYYYHHEYSSSQSPS